jgi:hypothetical protein
MPALVSRMVAPSGTVTLTESGSAGRPASFWTVSR